MEVVEKRLKISACIKVNYTIYLQTSERAEATEWGKKIIMGHGSHSYMCS